MLRPTTEFTPRVDYRLLTVDQVREQIRVAIGAFHHFTDLWTVLAAERWGESTAQEWREAALGGPADRDDDRTDRLYEHLNAMLVLVADMPELLTFGSLEGHALPPTLEVDCFEFMESTTDLLLFWNLCTLAYVMQGTAWGGLVERHHGKPAALEATQQVWVEQGGAEDDLRYGLDVAHGAGDWKGGNVETLFRGFQFAPGEVGLVDAEFQLHTPDHGTIVHRRCPAHDRFRDTDRETLENCCVICVRAMRLSGEMVDPSIRCRAASIPPHREPQDHACRWEYWVED